MTTSGPGRPRRSSAHTIEEAAEQLFLEQGYARTSMEQIAQRAGVSRATVFNYVAAKSDLLWLGVDEALDELEAELEAELTGGASVETVLAAVSGRTHGDRIPLALAQSGVMGAGEELLTSGMLRLARLQSVLRAALASRHPGSSRLELDVDAGLLAVAVSAAWRAWAAAGPGRDPLPDYLGAATARLDRGSGSSPNA